MTPKGHDSHISAPYTSTEMTYDRSMGRLRLALSLWVPRTGKRFRHISIKSISVGEGCSLAIRKKAEVRSRNIYLRARKLVAGKRPLECCLQDETCSGPLQIDHISNNGQEERDRQFYHDIVEGVRTTKDLRLLCSSHNCRSGRSLSSRLEARKSSRKYVRKIYAQALATVGPPNCALENETCSEGLVIHHLNGDGKEERQEKGHRQFYKEIVEGIRKTDDLQILCVGHNLRGAT